MTDWMSLLTEIADRADAISLRFFGTPRLRVDSKPDDSPVTEADRGIEEAARDLVRTRHPELGVLGEEHGELQGARDARLIIDPIDGTRNFVRGIPVFATLLAIEAAGEVVAALVSAPALHARWRAVKGAGAFRDDRRLAVSGITTLEQAQFFHGDLSGRLEGTFPAGVHTLIRKVARTRGFGDFYQHVLVAEGAGEIAFDARVKAWDVAPLYLIVEEAGGTVTTLSGQRDIHGGSLVTTNGKLHREAIEVLRAN